MILYHDATPQTFRGAIVTTETGDLISTPSLGAYGTAQEYGTFGIVDKFNYAMQFYKEGQILSIVSDAGAHGSHVAGIASAYHPASPQDDGVAPGARVIGLKIGDSRLASMETMPGLYRALLMAIELNIDVINLSYDEYAPYTIIYIIKESNQIIHSFYSLMKLV